MTGTLRITTHSDDCASAYVGSQPVGPDEDECDDYDV